MTDRMRDDAQSVVVPEDVEALGRLADSMGFGRTHDMLRRVIAALAPQPPAAPVETYTEICKSPHCPRGGVPVEIVGSAVKAMQDRNLAHPGLSAGNDGLRKALEEIVAEIPANQGGTQGAIRKRALAALTEEARK